jgi:hypothetical protein
MADSIVFYAEAGNISSSDFRMPVRDLDAQRALSAVRQTILPVIVLGICVAHHRESFDSTV